MDVLLYIVCMMQADADADAAAAAAAASQHQARHRLMNLWQLLGSTIMCCPAAARRSTKRHGTPDNMCRAVQRPMTQPSLTELFFCCV